MTRSLIISVIISFVSIILGIILSVFLSNNSSTQPNIIVIIADDVGWNDVSYHGSDQISTPNIDALSYHGVSLERHYAQQVCTPSRAAFLTGQYPIRIGFQGYPLNTGLPAFIPKHVNTLPRSLKNLGYRTHLVGKWHLGYGKREHTPLGYGYDSHYGYWNGYIGYFTHDIAKVGDKIYNGTDLHNDYAPVTDKLGEYATDLFTQKAQDIINDHPVSEPLYLLISHLAGHTGRTLSDGSTILEVHNITATNEKYSHINNIERRKYAEILERMDQSVGDVIETLARKNMLQNSVIAFFSDNGAPTYGMHANTGSNYPLRGTKMTMFEGGIRTPSVIYSPLIKNLGDIFPGLFHITDWVPTLYKAAGGNLEDLGKIDGINQWETIINDQNLHKRKELLVDIDPKFDYSAYIGYEGRYKLINNSNFYFDYTGDVGFSNPNKHYKDVVKSKTNIYLGQINSKKLSKDNVIARRDKTQLNCHPVLYAQLRQDIQPCTGLCLYDLVEDPCEYNDIASLHPEIVDELWHKILNLKEVEMPKPNLIFDSASDPGSCSNSWFNWLDDSGCWYNN